MADKFEPIFRWFVVRTAIFFLDCGLVNKILYWNDKIKFNSQSSGTEKTKFCSSQLSCFMFSSNGSSKHSLSGRQVAAWFKDQKIPSLSVSQDDLVKKDETTTDCASACVRSQDSSRVETDWNHWLFIQVCATLIQWTDWNSTKIRLLIIRLKIMLNSATGAQCNMSLEAVRCQI